MSNGTRYPERNYGLGDSTQFVRGAPRVVKQADGLPPCPVCKCVTLYDIEVDVDMPLLAGGKGVGHYTGCPACPFATPMLMVASGKEAPRG